MIIWYKKSSTKTYDTNHRFKLWAWMPKAPKASVCASKCSKQHWGLRYFWKRGNIRKGCVKIEDWGPLYNLYQCFRKILCKGCLIFNCCLVIKGILKALFPFVPWLLNFSDFPNFGSNSRKRYTLTLLSKCLVRSTLLPIGDKVPHNPSIPSSIFLDGLLLA